MKAVVSLSGGMDSITALALAGNKHGWSNIIGVGFQYPSKHNMYEMDCAISISRYYGVHWCPVDVNSVFDRFKSNLLRGGGAIPEGHYQEESMKQTVVPCRNMIFASILAGVAESNGCGEVWMGVHAGDHHIYPDCRPEFLRDMGAAIYEGTDQKVVLQTPFMWKSKAEILKMGLDLNVPYRLTRTCYKNQETACGLCGSCQERLEAFLACYVEDPLEYQTRTILVKEKKK